MGLSRGMGREHGSVYGRGRWHWIGCGRRTWDATQVQAREVRPYGASHAMYLEDLPESYIGLITRTDAAHRGSIIDCELVPEKLVYTYDKRNIV